jgi:hypothetical protein
MISKFFEKITEVNKTLVLSTYHVPYKTIAKVLDAMCSDNKVMLDSCEVEDTSVFDCFSNIPFGYKLRLDTITDDVSILNNSVLVPLYPVIVLAVFLGCNSITFDSDGPTLAGFPTFKEDWDK